MVSRSPGSRWATPVRSPLTNVPCFEPRSRTTKVPSARSISQWRRLTHGSVTRTWASELRPITAGKRLTTILRFGVAGSTLTSRTRIFVLAFDEVRRGGGGWGDDSGGLSGEGGNFRLVDDSHDALNVRNRLLGKLLVVEAGQATSQHQRTPFIPTGHTPHRRVRASLQALLGHLGDLMGTGTIASVRLRRHTTNRLCESMSMRIQFEAPSAATRMGKPGAGAQGSAGGEVGSTSRPATARRAAPANRLSASKPQNDSGSMLAVNMLQPDTDRFLENWPSNGRFCLNLGKKRSLARKMSAGGGLARPAGRLRQVDSNVSPADGRIVRPTVGGSDRWPDA